MDPPNQSVSLSRSRTIFPRDIIALVAAVFHIDTDIFVLVRNQHVLAVECPYNLTIPNYYEMNPDEQSRCKEDTGPDRIDIVLSLIHTIDFESTNYCYVVRRNGQPQLVPKHVNLYRVACPTWAPEINFTDIQVDRMYSGGHWFGYYNGRPIDMHVGFDNYALKHVERETNAHRILQQYDLTFELLGHVTQNDLIMGIMTEAAVGEPIQYRHKTLVYEATAMLLSRNIVCALNLQHMCIYRGKLKLCYNLYTIDFYSPSQRAQVLLDAESFVWPSLQYQFDSIADIPNDMPHWRVLGSPITNMTFVTSVSIPGCPVYLMPAHDTIAAPRDARRIEREELRRKLRQKRLGYSDDIPSAIQKAGNKSRMYPPHFFQNSLPKLHPYIATNRSPSLKFQSKRDPVLIKREPPEFFIDSEWMAHVELEEPLSAFITEEV